ncbi:MAG: biotin-dependent carboxyltransferase family protein [Gemmatimonadaceae bacterium]
MLNILRAPAYATVQDSGRTGFLDSGVPKAGAMDLPTFFTLNAMLANEPACSAIEWALSGGEIEFGRPTTFAVGGAAGGLALSGRDLEPWRAYTAEAGDKLVVGAPDAGRFIYIAVAGGFDVPLALGSRSTYVPGGLGGLEGRRLKSGDSIATLDPARRKRHQVTDPLPAELRPLVRIESVRYVPRESIELRSEWTVSPASDRTGYRLESTESQPGESVTSEPVCAGVIQLPPGGQPIVLMADAPTIGGYLIAGAVITADLGGLSQKLPGERIIFAPVGVSAAQRALEADADRVERVREWSLA